MVRVKREVPRPGEDVTIVITDRNRLLVNDVDMTDKYAGRTLDTHLIEELELDAEQGHFDNIRRELLYFIKYE